MRLKKPRTRKGKVLFIDAQTLFRKGRAQNFLEPEHARQIYQWYRDFADVEHHARVVSVEEIAKEDHTLNISRYVTPKSTDEIPPLPEAIAAFNAALARERAQSFLRPENQSRILTAYKAFAAEPGLAAVADTAKIEKQDWSLSIPLYVARPSSAAAADGDAAAPESLAEAWEKWKADGSAFWKQMDDVAAMLDGLVAEEASDG